MVETRLITSNDELFLWQMIFHASQLAKEGATSYLAAQKHPHVSKYVEGWGRLGDFGIFAYEANPQAGIGAAWLRLIGTAQTHYGYYNSQTPELAIAVKPEWSRKGVGQALLSTLIEQVQHEVPAIVLTVRNNNPAKKLYEKFGFQVIDEVTNRVGTRSSKMLLNFESSGKHTNSYKPL